MYQQQDVKVNLTKQKLYWQKQLGGELPVLEVPLDYPRSPIQSFIRAKETIEFDEEFNLELQKFCTHERVTLFTALLAAFKILLSRYTGLEDIVVGSLSVDSLREEKEATWETFTNLVGLRTSLTSHPSARELLRRVARTVEEATENRDYPFEELVENIDGVENPTQARLFQVMLVLCNVPSCVSRTSILVDKLEVVKKQTAKCDWVILASEDEGVLRISCEYNAELFESVSVRRMLGHFKTLLKSILANPDECISTLPLLTEVEWHQLLVEWNQTQADYPNDQCIHQLFEAQVERTPEAVAVVLQDKQLTYRELNGQANQLAHYLRSLGVGPDILVGICVERSLEMVVGLLGILKAGGAYVPLDPAYPEERLSFMLKDSQVSVLLTQKNLVARLPEHKACIICLDTDWETIAHENEEKVNPISAPTNLAYLLYTSGSTGRPKGVAIEHRSPVALVYWAREIFTSEDLAGVLASTSICFDLSVFELFVPLSWGGKVILAENALHLTALSTAKEVTLINTVPSAIAELLRVNSIPDSLRTVNLAGEPIPNQLVQQIYQQGTIKKVFNLYGPSEDTTYSSFALVEKGVTKSAPIGRPITNTQIYILDRYLQPVPIGVPGELHIGGAGLARGYFNRPELTTEKFIPNPFSNKPGERLYKTGDLARYLPDGNIEFISRIDNQVKIRGFRIELGEIEAVLTQHPAILQAVVVVR